MKYTYFALLGMLVISTSACTTSKNQDPQDLLLGNWDMEVDGLGLVVEFSDSNMKIDALGLDVSYDWASSNTISYNIQGQEIISTLVFESPNVMTQANFQGQFTLYRIIQ